MNGFNHIPVLLDQAIEQLRIKPDGIYLDATFGGGRHSKAILEKLDPEKGKLIAFDADQDAKQNAFDNQNFIFIHSNFIFIPFFLDFLSIPKVDGIIADLGVSSYQLDTPEKGFSYRFDAPLDMRMNKHLKLTAEKILNTYSAKQLQEIFSKYGEVHNAKTLAQKIVNAREKQPFTTTGQFVETIKTLVPKKAENKYLSKVFQALRIEVNNEMENLKKFLTNLPEILKPGGRAVIITFHSLEDRLVKNFFKTSNFDGKRLTDMYGNPITPFVHDPKKPVLPSENELKQNPRARSAKLRAATFLGTKNNLQ